MAKKNVALIDQGSYVILDCGLVRLTISKPQGLVTGIKYAGVDNLLDLKSGENSRGYWDVNWSFTGGNDKYLLLRGSHYSVIHTSNDQVEISFGRNYLSRLEGSAISEAVTQ